MKHGDFLQDLVDYKVQGTKYNHQVQVYLSGDEAAVNQASTPPYHSKTPMFPLARIAGRCVRQRPGRCGEFVAERKINIGVRSSLVMWGDNALSRDFSGKVPVWEDLDDKLSFNSKGLSCSYRSA